MKKKTGTNEPETREMKEEEKQARAARKAEKAEKATAKAEKPAKEKKSIGKEWKGALITLCVIFGALLIAAFCQSVAIPGVYYLRGEKLLGEERYEEAQTCYRKSASLLAKGNERAEECRLGILYRDYHQALDLMESGSYKEAIALFEKCGSYQGSAGQIRQCRYALADGLLSEGKFEEARAEFEKVVTLRDSAEKIKACDYGLALAAMEAGDYKTAKELLLPIRDYSDAASFLSVAKSKCAVEEIAAAAVGSTVLFGEYEQDNHTENGTEDIQWIVLENKDGRVLLLSKYVLDSKIFNSSNGVEWSKSSLRTWLNGTFLESAFCKEAAEYLYNNTLSVSKNPLSGQSTTTSTDRVWLLGVEEAKKFLPTEDDRLCEPTEYAIAKGAFRDESWGTCVWWLRTPGSSKAYAAYVVRDGRIDHQRGFTLKVTNVGIRPVIMVDTTVGAAAPDSAE